MMSSHALPTQASALSSRAILETLQAAGNPEVLATRLIQSTQSDTDSSPDCADKTGYEHCTDCAMPAINGLVDELVKVKDEVWSAQMTMASNAKTVCDQDTPANRAGGAAKCCSGGGTTSAYEAAGYNNCSTGSTFSPTDRYKAQTANVKFNPLKGFYFDTGTPSSMITDCCRTGSTCLNNDASIKDSMDINLKLLNTLQADLGAKQQKIDAVTIEAALETDKIKEYRSKITKMCTLVDETDTDTYGTTTISWPSDLAEATVRCASGQIKNILDREVARQITLTADVSSFQRTVVVIQRVIAWLNHDGANVLKDNEHATAPAVDSATTYAPGTTVAPSHDGATSTTGLAAHYNGAMVSLLEGAVKSATNAQAKRALSKAAKLLEGANSVGRGAAEVIRLLKQILGDMQSSQAKTTTFMKTSQAEANTQVENLVAQITILHGERLTAMLHKAQLMNTIAGYKTDVLTKGNEIANQKDAWVLKYDHRELNSKKCIEFMVTDASALLAIGHNKINHALSRRHISTPRRRRTPGSF